MHTYGDRKLWQHEANWGEEQTATTHLIHIKTNEGHYRSGD
jgi:hypothetical protein